VRCEWNADAGPFERVKTADNILAKAVRKTQAASRARHSTASYAAAGRLTWHRFAG